MCFVWLKWRGGPLKVTIKGIGHRWIFIFSLSIVTVTFTDFTGSKLAEMHMVQFGTETKSHTISSNGQRFGCGSFKMCQTIGVKLIYRKKVSPNKSVNTCDSISPAQKRFSTHFHFCPAQHSAQGKSRETERTKKRRKRIEIEQRLLHFRHLNCYWLSSGTHTRSQATAYGQRNEIIAKLSPKTKKSHPKSIKNKQTEAHSAETISPHSLRTTYVSGRERERSEKKKRNFIIYSVFGTNAGRLAAIHSKHNEQQQ